MSSGIQVPQLTHSVNWRGFRIFHEQFRSVDKIVSRALSLYAKQAYFASIVLAILSPAKFMLKGNTR